MRNERADTIRILSPLCAEQVLSNLKERGREWRESVLPADLRAVGAKQLSVQFKGNDFTMFWTGAASPLYNPALIGSVVDAPGGGSEIAAHIGRHVPAPIAFALLVALPLEGLLTSSQLLRVMVVLIVIWTVLEILLRGRGKADALEPHLLGVLSEAAKSSEKEAGRIVL